MSAGSFLEQVENLVLRIKPDDRKICYASHQSNEWLSIDNLVGKNLLELVVPDDHRKVQAALETTWKNSKSQCEVRLIRSTDKPRVWVELLMIRLVDDEILVCGKDISPWKDNEEVLSYSAEHDTLTKLANRSLLQKVVISTMLTASSTGAGFTLMLLDLDGFKKVNDTIGHAIGDEVLVQTAARLSNAVRNTDLVARIGGDEFVVVLTGTHEELNVRNVANKILSVIEAPFIVAEAGIPVHLSTSIGLAKFPEHGKDYNSLFKHADIALYRAKSLGKNRYQFYSPESPNLISALSLESALFSGIQDGEFELHYQPQFDTVTGKIIGAETLTRWKNAEFGQVSPEIFIPIAEENGLINLLGRWALRSACHQLREWHDAGHKLTVSVNVSAQQLKDNSFRKIVLETIEETEIDPTYLILEITESVLMCDPDRACVTLATLKKIGVNFSIDDFGIGFSSLSYLRKFPISELKIDKSFISEIPYNTSDISIVNAIISLAKELNLNCVAEGVETLEQHDVLRLKGCTFIQGFLLGRPMKIDQFNKFLNDGTWKKQ